MSQPRLVDSYTFTRLNDLRLCKQYLIGEGWDTLFVMEDYHLGTCCGKGSSDGRTMELKQVRTISYGRIRGCETCDECIAVEKDFLDMLKAFDETDEFEFDAGKAMNEIRSQDRAFEELKRKHKLSKDEKRRQELEAQGQGRLF